VMQKVDWWNEVPKADVQKVRYFEYEKEICEVSHLSSSADTDTVHILYYNRDKVISFARDRVS
jgi:hypothetical protein